MWSTDCFCVALRIDSSVARGLLLCVPRIASVSPADSFYVACNCFHVARGLIPCGPRTGFMWPEDCFCVAREMIPV